MCIVCTVLRPVYRQMVRIVHARWWVIRNDLDNNPAFDWSRKLIETPVTTIPFNLCVNVVPTTRIYDIIGYLRMSLRIHENIYCTTVYNNMAASGW